MESANGLDAVTWVAIGVAVYGAVLSTVLAWRQIWRERRRLRIMCNLLVYVQSSGTALEVLEVRALSEGRPVHVRQGGVTTADDSLYTPLPITPAEEKKVNRPALLNDGESASFYFDLLSLEDEWSPKAVWVEDFADRRYTKRLSRKKRNQIQAGAQRLRERLGPDVDSQQNLVRDIYRQTP